MNKVIESSWQSWLIALGLLIMIPATIWFGMNFIAPKVDSKHYWQLRSEYFKQCQQGQRDEKMYEKCEKEWSASPAGALYQEQLQNRSRFEILTSGPLVLALVALSSVINIAIIAASFIGSAVILHFLYVVSGHSASQTTLIMVWQLVMAFMSLMLVLWCAYRDSKG